MPEKSSCEHFAIRNQIAGARHPIHYSAMSCHACDSVQHLFSSNTQHLVCSQFMAFLWMCKEVNLKRCHTLRCTRPLKAPETGFDNWYTCCRFKPSDGVICIAATNFPQSLDKALIRPGRFDRHVTVPNPDVKGRKEILEVHFKNVPAGKDVDLKVGTCLITTASLWHDTYQSDCADLDAAVYRLQCLQDVLASFRQQVSCVNFWLLSNPWHCYILCQPGFDHE